MTTSCGAVHDASGMRCIFTQPHEVHSWAAGVHRTGSVAQFNLYDPTNAAVESQAESEKELRPDYYKNMPIEPWEIIKAYDLGYWDGTALKYILRAGRKPGQPTLDDIRKAYTFLGELISLLEASPKDQVRETPQYIEDYYGNKIETSKYNPAGNDRFA